MGIFKRQIDFLNDLEENLTKILQDTINDGEFILKEYITTKQLFEKGIDGKGLKLEPYTRTTIRLKLSKTPPQPVDRTTLFDEGNFHASITIEAFSDRYEVSSDVQHDKYIIKRYGRNVLKITDENFSHFLRVYFIPNLKRYVANKFTK